MNITSFKKQRLMELSKKVTEEAQEEVAVEETKEQLELFEGDKYAVKKVSTAKMEKAVLVVQDEFNLVSGDFTVNGFVDKGSKCQISVSNDDFDLTIVVKDAEKYGIL